MDHPPGWDYNPASLEERLPLLVMALLGFCIAAYLALYQLGVLDHVWEPFFGDGSRQILNSKFSRMLPIPDASLGAFAYLVDGITGSIGGNDRWRSKPWAVVIFALAVGSLGFTSVVLVIVQPVLFNAWCTLCLASACISILMTGRVMAELLATLQHLQHVRARGDSWWRALWGHCRVEEN